MILDLKQLNEQLKSKEIINNVLLIGSPFHIIENKKRNEIKRILDSKNIDDNFLNKIYGEIEREKIRLIKEVDNFYSSSITDEYFLNKNSTIEDLIKKTNDFAIQLMKLSLVYNPDFYKSFSSKKGSDSKYDMVKINWIDDDGKKFRKFAKNYGKEGREGTEKSLLKILEEFLDNTGEPIFEKRFKTVDELPIVFDLYISINGIDWVFETKRSSKDDFINTAVILESWKLYKNDYGI
ncbi:hypothetical protein [Chryseobacterium sp.]|uniref:hypothetical protein n=1 Tax=Chryseobacterium sp. TaxID=1871047 RepID=UPI0024E260F8|nr:hypothetical protein [Chryseobacterium sp.]